MKFFAGDKGLLVEKLEFENKSEGGIVIPGSSKELYFVGTVAAIGNDIADRNSTSPFSINVGDMVYWAANTQTPVMIFGKPYQHVKSEFILVVIPQENINE